MLDGARRAVDPRETPIVAVVLVVALIAAATIGATLGVAALTHPASAPASTKTTGLALSLSSPVESSPSHGQYWEKITIAAASAGITTSLFGFELKDGMSASIAPGAPTAGCAYSAGGTSFGATNCAAPAMGWYAVLYWTGNGSVANAYGGATPSWTAPTLPVSTAETLVIVSPDDLQHSTDELSVVSTGTPTVSGMCGPF